MKDATDSFTQELNACLSEITQIMIAGIVEKASKRGRPKLANPLTPAERARRYRLRQRYKNLALF